MHVTIKNIIESPLFYNVEILAGNNGLSRPVKRVNVADVKIHENNDNEALFPEGDLFMSCFEQFEAGDPADVEEYFQALIKYRCSGLLLVEERNKCLITPKIAEMCNQANFPVLCLQQDISYAEIISIVNRFILIEDLNLLRANEFRRIMTENLTEQETMEILDGFSSSIERYLRVICFIGKPISNMLHSDFHVDSINAPAEIFIEADGYNYYIVSSSSPERLGPRTKVIKQMISRCYHVDHIAVSHIYEKWNIKKATNNAKTDCRIAYIMGKKENSVQSLSSYPMLLSLESSYEAKAFYEEYLDIIAKNTSEKHMQDLLETVRAYVLCCGNYKETANVLHQHENTIRYRINSLRVWLEMDEDPIQFNEIISLAVKLEQINTSKRTGYPSKK